MIGYHASSEQYGPSELLHYAQLAQESGFGFVNCSDHFHPWSEDEGHSPFAWSWLGAAMHATALPFSVITCPVGRYHPAIIAQAVATLLELFPGRLSFIAGSGELLNEGITGAPWPDHAMRNARLEEAVDVMRALWRGETVTQYGPVSIREARLYDAPAAQPAVLCAVFSEKSAHWAGGWADGLVTSARPREELSGILGAFRDSGGRAKPAVLKVDVAWGDTAEEALEGARRAWRAATLGRAVAENLRTPAEFDAATRFVRAADMRGTVRFGDADHHVAELTADIAMGFDRVIVHCVNPVQERFIAEFGRDVIPRVETS